MLMQRLQMGTRLLWMLVPGAMLAHGSHGHEELDWHRPEAWALKYFASAALHTGYGPEFAQHSGTWSLGVETVQLPYLKLGYRTVGFVGQKEENLNHLPVLLRPVARVHGPARTVFSAAWIPPVRIDGVRTHGAFGAAQWTALEHRGWALSARAFGQVLRSRGPFTAWEELAAAGMDPVRNPWGVTGPSNDRAVLDSWGGEVALGWRSRGGWQPFIAASRTRMDLRFDVDSSLFGEPHHNHQRARGWQTAFSAGFRHRISHRWEWGVQGFYAPLKVQRTFGGEVEEDSLVHLRLMLARRW